MRLHPVVLLWLLSPCTVSSARPPTYLEVDEQADGRLTPDEAEEAAPEEPLPTHAVEDSEPEPKPRRTVVGEQGEDSEPERTPTQRVEGSEPEPEQPLVREQGEDSQPGRTPTQRVEGAKPKPAQPLVREQVEDSEPEQTLTQRVEGAKPEPILAQTAVREEALPEVDPEQMEMRVAISHSSNATSSASSLAALDSRRMSLACNALGPDPPLTYVLPIGSALGKAHLDSGKFPVLTEVKWQSIQDKAATNAPKYHRLWMCRLRSAACHASWVSRRHQVGLAASVSMMDSALAGAGYQWVCLAFLAGVAMHNAVALVFPQSDTKGGRQPPSSKAAQTERSQDGGEEPLAHPLRIHDCMTRWWSEPPGFSHPRLTVKLYVVVLVCVSVLGGTAPETCPLAAPEVVRLFRSSAANVESIPSQLIPPVADILMPGLSDDTAEAWATFLSTSRDRLLSAWLLFVILPDTSSPAATQVLGNICYIYGAILYTFLGLVEMSYVQASTSHATVLFVLSIALALPVLDGNPQANSWLRTFLLVNVLVPVYLFSEIANLRYRGPSAAAAFAGQQLMMPDDSFSWRPLGLLSVVLQTLMLALPFVALLTTHQPFAHSKCRASFLLGAFAHQLCSVLRAGGNPALNSLLCLLLLDPLSWAGAARQGKLKSHGHHQELGAAKRGALQHSRGGDFLRAGFAWLVVFFWWAVQFWADLDVLWGVWSPCVVHDPLLPFPEMAIGMQATRPCHGFTFLLLCTAYLGFLAKIGWDMKNLVCNGPPAG